MLESEGIHQELLEGSEYQEMRLILNSLSTSPKYIDPDDAMVGIEKTNNSVI